MTRHLVRCFYPFAVGFMMTAVPQASIAGDLLVYVSAFAKGEDASINAYQLELETGKLKLVQQTKGMEHPFFMVLSPNRKFLYAIHAPGQFGGTDNEQIAAYEIVGPTGQLKLLNRQSALGTAACYLEIDATGKTVLVANYSSGSVAALPVRPDGSLGEAATFIPHADLEVDRPKQAKPHAHCAVVTPDNRFVLTADLGFDLIQSYRLDSAAAKLTPNKQPFVRTSPGAGPRHLTFDPQGKRLYAINELKSSISLFDYLPESGILIEQQTLSTLPPDFDGVSKCADLKFTPNGRFLYGTNRGHDSIARYRIDDAGRMKLLGIDPSLGKGPQNLAITPNGEFLLCANMPGNNVAVFRIDSSTGSLKQVGEPIAITSPSCIRIQ